MRFRANRAARLLIVVLGAGIVYALYRTVIWYGGGPA